MSAVAVGIDLGGTSCRVCLVGADGVRLAAVKRRHEPNITFDALIDQLTGLVQQVSERSHPIGAGVGIAGWLDARGVVAQGMTNLPILAGIPLAERLQADLDLPVRLENDARAAMLGEARYGAARGVRDALMVTLGTGIGGGLMLDGQIRHGLHGSAGEIELMRSMRLNREGLPEWVALEDLASPGGLFRTASVSMEVLAKAAKAGDARARGSLERIFDLLGLAIANAHVMVDLELVLMSGGMAKMGADLVVGVTRCFRHHCPIEMRNGLRLELAQLGEWAGATGAASLWLDAVQTSA